MMIERAKPPASALWWWPMPRSGSFTLTHEREHEDADHDRREAVQDVEPEPDLLADPPWCELTHVDRRQHAGRQRQRGRRGDEDGSVPTSAGAIPPPDSPNVAGPFVKKSQLSA